MKKTPKISIAIPTYEMDGKGHLIIQHAFMSLDIQTFRDFEVVVSDQSDDDLTEEVCKKWSYNLNIVYLKNPENKGYYTANTNNAVFRCRGEVVKYLDADDYLYEENALQAIYDAFDGDAKWLASDYVHTYDRLTYTNRHSPHWSDPIYLYNTIGSPTGVSVRKPYLIPMDEHYRWMGDADLYQMMFDKWGKPAILRTITAVHLLWEGQNSNVYNALQKEEIQYAISKYERESV